MFFVYKSSRVTNGRVVDTETRVGNGSTLLNLMYIWLMKQTVRWQMYEGFLQGTYIYSGAATDLGMDMVGFQVVLVSDLWMHHS